MSKLLLNNTRLNNTRADTHISVNAMLKVSLLLLLGCILFSANSAAQELDVPVVYISRDIEPLLPLSLIDKRVEKDGFAGAQLGLADNQTTGSFLGHTYRLVEILVPEDADLLATVKPVSYTHLTLPTTPYV